MSWGDEYLSTGLIDACTATVLTSRFGSNPEYTNDAGEPILRLLWQLGDIEADEDAPETFEERYSIGKGVEAVDDGKRVVRTDGKPVKFNEKTQLGLLIKRVAKDPAFAKLADEWAAADANPSNAGIWQGRRFRFERTTLSYGEGFKDKKLLLPVEYLGTMGGGIDMFATAEANLAAGGVITNGQTVREKLAVLAENATSQGTFAAAAIALPEVQADSALAQEVLSGAFYTATTTK